MESGSSAAPPVTTTGWRSKMESAALWEFRCVLAAYGSPASSSEFLGTQLTDEL